MKHDELFSDLEKNGTEILQLRMPGWAYTWYVLPRPRGLRYVGVVNRRPALVKPSRYNFNRRPTPLLRSLDDVIWFTHAGMDRTEIIFVHSDYAVALGKALVSFVNHSPEKDPSGGASWTRSWQRSYQCGVIVPDDGGFSLDEPSKEAAFKAKLITRDSSSALPPA